MGDPYGANWPIFPERGAAIAESVQGDLVAAAPGSSVAAARPRTRSPPKAASLIAAEAQKPLSTAALG
jgi:hypothetical protein